MLAREMHQDVPVLVVAGALIALPAPCRDKWDLVVAAEALQFLIDLLLPQALPLVACEFVHRGLQRQERGQREADVSGMMVPVVESDELLPVEGARALTVTLVITLATCPLTATPLPALTTSGDLLLVCPLLGVSPSWLPS